MKRYTNTERSTALRLLRARKLPRHTIAEIVGCQLRTVTRWAAAIGIDVRRGKGGRPLQMTPRTQARIVRLRHRGLPMREIADIVGVHGTTVLRALRREGVL